MGGYVNYMWLIDTTDHIVKECKEGAGQNQGDKKWRFWPFSKLSEYGRGSMGLGRIRIIAEVFRGRGSAKKWPLVIGEGLRYWGYHWSKLLTLTLIKNIDIDIEEKKKLTLTLTLRHVNYHESTLTLVLTLRFEKHWHWIEHWHWPLKTIDIDIALKISTLLMSDSPVKSETKKISKLMTARDCCQICNVTHSKRVAKISQV